MNITELNVDVLVEIFSHLNLQEQFVASAVCREFEKVTHTMFDRIKTITDTQIKLDDFPTSESMEFLFKKMGQTLHTITFENINYDTEVAEKMLIFIEKYCPNVKKLTLIWKRNVSLNRPFPKGLTFLKTNINCDDNLIKKHLRKSFSTLETLILQDNQITGYCLFGMTNVRYLELDNLPALDQNNLQQYFQLNKKIKHLKLIMNVIHSGTVSKVFQFLQEIETLDIEVIEVRPLNVHLDLGLMKHLKSLRHLKLNIGGKFVYTNKIIELISDLKSMEHFEIFHNIKLKSLLDEDSLNYFRNSNLKILSLNHCFFVNNDLLYIFGMKNNLNELHLYDCLNFTSAALEVFLTTATNLKYLTINYCVLMKRTEEFIRDIEDQRDDFRACLTCIISCEEEEDLEGGCILN